MKEIASDLVTELEAIVGPGGLLTGEDVTGRSAGIWRRDHLAAQILVRPKTTDQVAAILKLCNVHGQSVVTQGGLTNLVHSADTKPDDVVLSLERMTGVEDIDPIGRTMTVWAGTPLAVLQDEAAEHGLIFPLDLGARGSCTIGGNIATNAGGNRVIRFGMTRAMVLGLEAVLADGTVLSSMNRMIKNNAGYDLKQLFIGSEGTLGVVTRAVLRLFEKPEGEPTALVACDGFAGVTGLLSHLGKGLGGALSAFEVLWASFYEKVTAPTGKTNPPLARGMPFYVLVEGLGTSQDSFEACLADALQNGLISDAVIAQSESDRLGIWAVRDSVDQLVMGGSFTFDVSLPIRDMEDYVSTVDNRVRREWADPMIYTFGHLGDGNIHFVIHPGERRADAHERVEAAVYEPLQKLQGSVSAEHGVGLEKKPWLYLSRSSDEIAVMKRLKAALDPNHILNPGQIF